MKKSVKLITVTTLLILLISIFIYITYIKDKEIDTENPTNIVEDEDLNNTQQKEDNLNFNTEYVGDSTWEYTITGTLPNPCYKYNIEEIVMESYPEQVVITMNIEQTGDVCIQVIQEVEEKGTFSASQEAQVSFKVNQ
jgi:hypothetical protein